MDRGQRYERIEPFYGFLTYADDTFYIVKGSVLMVISVMNAYSLLEIKFYYTFPLYPL